jgi:hypothetical protein
MRLEFGRNGNDNFDLKIASYVEESAKLSKPRAR